MQSQKVFVYVVGFWCGADGTLANFVAGPEDIEGESGQGVKIAKFSRECTADTEQPLAQHHLQPEFAAEHDARQPCEPHDPEVFLLVFPPSFRG